MIFVKNPWERYLSGLYEFTERKLNYKRGEFYTLEDMKDVYKKLFISKGREVRLPYIPESQYVIFDEHTMPMYIFCSAFIHCDYEIRSINSQMAIREWFGMPPNTEIERLDPSPSLFKEYFNDKLRSNTEWYDNWRRIFEEDYFIWDKFKLCENIYTDALFKYYDL